MALYVVVFFILCYISFTICSKKRNNIYSVGEWCLFSMFFNVCVYATSSRAYKATITTQSWLACFLFLSFFFLFLINRCLGRCCWTDGCELQSSTTSTSSPRIKTVFSSSKIHTRALRLVRVKFKPSALQALQMPPLTRL